jgi:hypothetical protein
VFDVFGMLQQNKGCSSLCGPVAQLGARFHGMEEVIGSIPIRSTKSNQQLSEAAEKSALCFPLGWRKRLGVEIRRSGIRM